MTTELEKENQKLREVLEMVLDIPYECHKCGGILSSVDEFIYHDCNKPYLTVHDGGKKDRAD